MIIHCTTPQQIEDVIKTESMNMYTSPEKIFKSYGMNSCIDNGSYGSLEFHKSYGYTITPYVEWKINNIYKEIEIIKDKVEKCTTIKQIEILEEELLERFKERDILLMASRINKQKERSNMKEMYLGNKFYGKFGEATDMTYEDGSIVHVGDIVEVFEKGNYDDDACLVCKDENDDRKYGVMGVWSLRFVNGKSDDWRIRLVCKYYINDRDKVGDIVIVNKDQFIQLEGGKLNITKARELGLWKEDKKVFTIDKNCEIEFNEYKIKSTVNTFWKRIVRIFNRDELVIELVNPTPDKVRHEFSYYGIEVDVI